MSCPEQPAVIEQVAGNVCTVLGMPVVVSVVANVVVEVEEKFKVAESTVTVELVKVAMLSEPVIKVEP